ncbi:RNA 2',3'-cyclic phosphodiesterase [Methylotuvimicrobium alcaliphilum]|uniref:RNA 2',3'-cyclic phosphodiesterase n=1 Tax=Methylotuvimicrobium alcaliphilum (strain DSM 19304 / NCIMB 14124 / VKM B-2133 / 20Z) TaxID=1091494 RepID=G4SXN9_META2|nr:RNA 2',3'-cyclic phosphodiesterase [Methylotuvimicrobium alcaliphilum]CCE22094.1 2'-5' RNA ligase [Methylotuvimicrobium alcaliphilum 20Z]
MKRLFFALWPDEAVRRQCTELAHRLLKAEDRSVNPGNLHVTLVFLGAVGDVLESAMVQAAGEMKKLQPVAIHFDELSFWRKPGIICLTSSNPDDKAMILAEHLSALVSSFGHSIDERSYRPHVTLIRKAKQSVQTEFEPIIWHSNTFCLVESCSAPGGVDYRVIRQWPLLG